MRNGLGTKYDDAGWHIGADNYPPDQPEENGFVHMAAYLAWIVRRGWYNPELFRPDDIRPIQQREPGAAIHLMEMSDAKLVDEDMTRTRRISRTTTTRTHT